MRDFERDPCTHTLVKQVRSTMGWGVLAFLRAYSTRKGVLNRQKEMKEEGKN